MMYIAEIWLEKGWPSELGHATAKRLPAAKSGGEGMSQELFLCPICGAKPTLVDDAGIIYAYCLAKDCSQARRVTVARWNERARHAHELRQRAEAAEALLRSQETEFKESYAEAEGAGGGMKFKRYEMFVDDLGNLASMPDEDGLYANADEAEARIDELEAENTRLRELLMAAKEHIGCSCMDCARVDNACREEIERWEK